MEVDVIKVFAEVVEYCDGYMKEKSRVQAQSNNGFMVLREELVKEILRVLWEEGLCE